MGLTGISIVVTAATTAAGGLAGYGVHRFVGCRSGACPLWSRAWAATLYGALLGFVLGAR